MTMPSRAKGRVRWSWNSASSTGMAGEDYGGGSVRRAYETFNVLQHGLPDWVDKASKTKTAFVYG